MQWTPKSQKANSSSALHERVWFVALAFTASAEGERVVNCGWSDAVAHTSLPEVRCGNDEVNRTTVRSRFASSLCLGTSYPNAHSVVCPTELCKSRLVPGLSDGLGSFFAKEG